MYFLGQVDSWESFGEFQNSFEDCLSSKIGLLISKLIWFSAESMLIFDFDKRFWESKIILLFENKILYCLG